MGEKADAGYGNAEREAFAALPAKQRLLANLVAVLVTGLLALAFAIVFIGPVFAESVTVKYRDGPVDLANFDCTGDLDSSLVKRICYSAANSYMLIRLKGTWYHYCEIDTGTVDALLNAESLGRFYNQSVKDSGTGGRFSCRDSAVPKF
ncbi:MAG: KTSC domain-containing protein [Alphaproteobacteria bacterium]|nr:KTSC domain-containing protein [Alphaproteobacteria bacterium]MBU0804314.1 KTSC domain-containing protein [Alphaproteobacteria bacterium]MBU0871145.1 KTSC domain-containing protein [Alphaproteobacteria bacterium]MBU1400900.1 KTSC domain-containing protein [Alphaproteobacteria bacterium]MBU1592683.1 KTSC domain-containing protein [Alphaproteobacteria bacterium]